MKPSDTMNGSDDKNSSGSNARVNPSTDSAVNSNIGNESNVDHTPKRKSESSPNGKKKAKKYVQPLFSFSPVPTAGKSNPARVTPEKDEKEVPGFSLDDNESQVETILNDNLADDPSNGELVDNPSDNEVVAVDQEQLLIVGAVKENLLIVWDKKEYYIEVPPTFSADLTTVFHRACEMSKLDEEALKQVSCADHRQKLEVLKTLIYDAFAAIIAYAKLKSLPQPSKLQRTVNRAATYGISMGLKGTVLKYGMSFY